jgi:hypothetical protein
MRSRKRKVSRLRKRYGCFMGHAAGVCEPESSSTACPPKMKEAKSVKAASRKGANWLARTDPKAKEVEFASAFDHLTPEGKRYIVLHERAHLNTGTDHNASFYTELRKLIKANSVSWEVAYELESFNCHAQH